MLHFTTYRYKGSRIDIGNFSFIILSNIINSKHNSQCPFEEYKQKCHKRRGSISNLNCNSKFDSWIYVNTLVWLPSYRLNQSLNSQILCILLVLLFSEIFQTKNVGRWYQVGSYNIETALQRWSWIYLIYFGSKHSNFTFYVQFSMQITP